MIICIGPKGSGKTLLLRRLQQTDIFVNPYEKIFATVPTVGVNIASVTGRKKNQVQVNELGGSIAAIWPMHFEDASGVIYVIDAVNIFQISCACIPLLEALQHDSLQDAKFMIVFNKTDIYCSTHLSEIKSIIRLDDICLHAKQDITVLDCSCLTGKGIKDIKRWLMQFVS